MDYFDFETEAEIDRAVERMEEFTNLVQCYKEQVNSIIW